MFGLFKFQKLANTPHITLLKILAILWNESVSKVRDSCKACLTSEYITSHLLPLTEKVWGLSACCLVLMWHFLESLLIAFLCLKEEMVRNQKIFLMNSWFSESSDLPVKEWWFLRFFRGPPNWRIYTWMATWGEEWGEAHPWSIHQEVT